MNDWHYWGIVSNLWFVGAYLNQDTLGSFIMILLGFVFGIATITALFIDSKIARLEREINRIFQRIVIDNLISLNKRKNGTQKRHRN